MRGSASPGCLKCADVISVLWTMFHIQFIPNKITQHRVATLAVVISLNGYSIQQRTI